MRARCRPHRPAFLLTAVLTYRARHRLTLHGLGAFLGTDVRALPRVATARCPDPASPRFGPDVDELAARLGCRPERLAALIHEAADLLRSGGG